MNIHNDISKYGLLHRKTGSIVIFDIIGDTTCLSINSYDNMYNLGKFWLTDLSGEAELVRLNKMNGIVHNLCPNSLDVIEFKMKLDISFDITDPYYY